MEIGSFPPHTDTQQRPRAADSRREEAAGRTDLKEEAEPVHWGAPLAATADGAVLRSGVS